MVMRALLIQLARLGDLVQTIPAITSLHERHADWVLDLLCPISLEGLGRMFPGISRVVPWDGMAWNRRAMSAEGGVQAEHVAEADAECRAITNESYDYGIVLNQHARSILAGALLAKKLMGSITGGPLDQQLSPWATYLRSVAAQRGSNRVHLADAFCGMCGVLPPKHVPTIEVPSSSLPGDLELIGQSTRPWIGLIVGAGDPERVVPSEVWTHFIVDCMERLPSSRMVLIGQAQEQARAEWIQSSLPSSLLGRVWDTTGRLSLTELAAVLTRCQIVVGADTGPLHLAAAVGTKVIGWYFARARVHETGPYGEGHWVWQVEGVERNDQAAVLPYAWPIQETIALVSQASTPRFNGWSLWASRRDQWGAYYVEAGHDPIAPIQREQVWQDFQLSAA